jgi:ubiquinone/menaquinone biosynthesis C-methylase UbiE
VDYWARKDIHTLGNVGFGGAVHAAMAPLATKMIDVKAYGGVDVRALISQELRSKVNKTQARVIDFCSGVGMSTRALEKAFHDAEYIVGVDTSEEMIRMAEVISRHEFEFNKAFGRHVQGLSMLVNDGLKSLLSAFSEEANPSPCAGKCQASYIVSNAESTHYPAGMFDIVTIMYGFHEIPEAGRNRIINEAKRLLRTGGHLAVLDICPTYMPSEYMLAGEPFVKEYQRNIDSQLFNFEGFSAKKRVVVAGHVNLWLLTKNESTLAP